MVRPTAFLRGGGLRRRAGIALVVLALGVGAAVASSRSGGHAACPASESHVEIVPECDEIGAWVLHFRPENVDLVGRTFRSLLAAIPRDVRVFIAVESAADVTRCRRMLGSRWGSDARLQFLTVGEGVSIWARDRYLLYTKGREPHARAIAPGRINPLWRGDVRVPWALKTLIPGLQVHETEQIVEGGDLLLTDGRVFVGAETVAQNQGHVGTPGDPFLLSLEEAFGRTGVVVHGGGEYRLPWNHIDMFLTPLGAHDVLLGDPRLALRAFGTGSDFLELGELGSFRRARQEAFVPNYEAVASTLRGHGLNVHRIPILHGEKLADGRPGPVITWNNAVLEKRDGEAHVYIPRYGIPDLDDLGTKAWTKLGFTVHPVDVRVAITIGGGLRCLTQTLPKCVMDGVPAPQ